MNYFVGTFFAYILRQYILSIISVAVSCTSLNNVIFCSFVCLFVKSTGKCEKKKSYVKKKDHRLDLCGPEGYVGKQVSKYEYKEN